MTALPNLALNAQMSDMTDKEQLLESSGYRYHFERMIFFNRSARRAFSLEFMENNTQERIQELVDMPATNDWVFHFNRPASDWQKRELAEALEK